ncbi:hypothetical protein B0H14DRAFT_2650001 [Mycena olivaceomarginata]|nr:hypothetical protein B0H14DRAFT_2650001 [Mycena olivaceomarginata]
MPAVVRALSQCGPKLFDSLALHDHSCIGLFTVTCHVRRRSSFCLHPRLSEERTSNTFCLHPRLSEDLIIVSSFPRIDGTTAHIRAFHAPSPRSLLHLRTTFILNIRGRRGSTVRPFTAVLRETKADQILPASITSSHKVPVDVAVGGRHPRQPQLRGPTLATLSLHFLASSVLPASITSSHKVPVDVAVGGRHPRQPQLCGPTPATLSLHFAVEHATFSIMFLTELCSDPGTMLPLVQPSPSRASLKPDTIRTLMVLKTHLKLARKEVIEILDDADNTSSLSLYKIIRV